MQILRTHAGEWCSRHCQFRERSWLLSRLDNNLFSVLSRFTWGSLSNAMGALGVILAARAHGRGQQRRIIEHEVSTLLIVVQVCLVRGNCTAGASLQSCKEGFASRQVTIGAARMFLFWEKRAGLRLLTCLLPHVLSSGALLRRFRIGVGAAGMSGQGQTEAENLMRQSVHPWANTSRR